MQVGLHLHISASPPGAAASVVVEKGVLMYQKPEIVCAGPASELIQGMPGFGQDGNPNTLNSKVVLLTALEEE